MRLGKVSVRKILGKSKEAVCYGLVDCNYLKVAEALKSMDGYLEVNPVAKLSGNKSSIIDAELRRCFKSYYEMNAEMRRVAEETFKFVCVRQDKNKSELYHLDVVPPFWKRPEWVESCLERSAVNENKNASVT